MVPTPAAERRAAALREASHDGRPIRATGSLRHCDLSGLDLRGAHLAGVGARGADFSGANLGGADLSGAGLKHADLSRANLEHANLSGTNLQYAVLHEANIAGANLSGADLTGAKMYSATLVGAVLADATAGHIDLAFANLTAADLRGADLSRGDLEWARFLNADLSRAVLKDGRLSYASLSSADLTGADLANADLRDTNMYWPNLTGAVLTEVVLGRDPLQHTYGYRSLGSTPVGSALIYPDLDGWRIVVGHWTGSPETLREIVHGDLPWSVDVFLTPSAVTPRNGHLKILPDIPDEEFGEDISHEAIPDGSSDSGDPNGFDELDDTGAVLDEHEVRWYLDLVLAQADHFIERHPGLLKTLAWRWRDGRREPDRQDHPESRERLESAPGTDEAAGPEDLTRVRASCSVRAGHADVPLATFSDPPGAAALKALHQLAGRVSDLEPAWDGETLIVEVGGGGYLVHSVVGTYLEQTYSDDEMASGDEIVTTIDLDGERGVRGAVDSAEMTIRDLIADSVETVLPIPEAEIAWLERLGDSLADLGPRREIDTYSAVLSIVFDATSRIFVSVVDHELVCRTWFEISHFYGDGEAESSFPVSGRGVSRAEAWVRRTLQEMPSLKAEFLTESKARDA